MKTTAAENTAAGKEFTTAAFMKQLLSRHVEDGTLISSGEYGALLKNERYDINDFYNAFYNMDGKGYPTSYNPSKIADYIIENVPYFILEDGTFYVYKNGAYFADPKQTTAKLIIENLIKPDDRRRNKTAEVIELLRNQPARELTIAELNQQPKHFICFKNGMYDLKNRCMTPHKPEYFCINQIPQEYDPDAQPEGEKVKAYLNDICTADDDRTMLLAYAGYCLTCSTDLQKFLMIYGQPGTGKSTLINLLTHVIGASNVANKSLLDICTDRFAAYGIIGKLCNFSADLEAKAIEDPATLKKITGQDNVTVQRKGVDGFDTPIYARLMFSANELPPIRTKDDAFFRRVWVLHVNKPPKAPNPRLLDDLKSEADYLLHLMVAAAERLFSLSDDEIARLESAKSIEMRKTWQMKGDTVAAFLYEVRPFSETARVRFTDLFRQYEAYCDEQDRTALKKTNFYGSLREKGFTETIIDGYPHFIAPPKYRLKKDFIPAELDNPFS